MVRKDIVPCEKDLVQALVPSLRASGEQIVPSVSVVSIDGCAWSEFSLDSRVEDVRSELASVGLVAVSNLEGVDDALELAPASETAAFQSRSRA